jgi:alpha-ketoglutarate-dependent taurine dioxygenase
LSGIKVTNLRDDLQFGARIAGVSWETLADQAVRAEINRVFEQRGVIVFDDVEPSSKMQVELSKVFGPLKDHPTKSTPRDSDSEDLAHGVIDMHHVPSEDPENVDGLVEIKGQRLARYSPWHFDHCYNDELNRAGVLRAPINAPVGGRTGFMDGVELYKRFPQALRDRLEKLNIIYTLDTRLTKMRFGVNFIPLGDPPQTQELLKEVAIFPRAMHPAVWTRRPARRCCTSAPGCPSASSTMRTPKARPSTRTSARRSCSWARPTAPTGTTGSRPTC